MRFLFRKLRSCGRSKKKNGSGSNSSSGSSSSSTNSSTGSVVGIKMTAAENGLMEKRAHNYNGNSGNTKATANYLAASSNRYGYNAHYSHQQQHQQQQSSHHNQHSPSVPISICVMILICYVTMGAVLFNRIQSWGVLESLYFCFTSLGTIGFGDLLPKGNVAQYAASAYILVGMAVVAMCFSLIQTELIMWLRRFGVQDTQQTHPSSTSMPASYNHMIHTKHHNHMFNQMNQSQASEDVALVTVAVTPKSWLRQPDFLGGVGALENTTTFNSLPRRSTAFQRNTPARRSAGPMESHLEYFVPRSVSEFNLSGVGDIAIPMHHQQQHQQQMFNRRSPPNISSSTIMIPIQPQHPPHPPKPREKMVTFEDDAKCPHGVPTTPRKSLPIVGDVFMWREGGWDEHETMQCPGDVIKV